MNLEQLLHAMVDRVFAGIDTAHMHAAVADHFQPKQGKAADQAADADTKVTGAKVAEKPKA